MLLFIILSYEAHYILAIYLDLSSMSVADYQLITSYIRFVSMENYKRKNVSDYILSST